MPVALAPLITEAAAVGLDVGFRSLEDARASADIVDASWMVEAVVADWGGSGSQQASFGMQLAETFMPNKPASELGEPLQLFCVELLDQAQAHLDGRLNELRGALEASPSTRELGLNLAVSVLVSRKEADGEYADEIIHADAFDGTVVGLAFVCSKMGTRLFPAATFAEAPVEQFIRESETGKRNGLSRVVEGAEGEMRTLQPATLLTMPPAVAHARPDGRVDDYQPAGPRWFARAHIELRPRRGRGAWDSTQRMQVGLLVAEHVWRDSNFAAAVQDHLNEREIQLRTAGK
jgi:hypothetical protein